MITAITASLNASRRCGPSVGERRGSAPMAGDDRGASITRAPARGAGARVSRYAGGVTKPTSCMRSSSVGLTVEPTTFFCIR